jgi:tetratricopeptide (TPR) repeat protein
MSGGEELDPEQAERLADLIGETMAAALRTADPAALQGEVRRLLPEVVPQMAAAAPDEVALRSLEASLARAIWNAAPLPSNAYRARPLPEPERNAPCPCGSGAKYKRCCARLAHLLPPITPEAAWQALGPHLSAPEVERALDTAALPPEALAPLARRVLELRGPRRAWKRLQQHLPSTEALDSRHEEALILAIDLDADLRGEDAALERALERAVALPPELGAAVFRHLVPLALGMDEADLARDLFDRARRDHPDHPDLALLEVSMGLAAGDLDRARDRAAFWLAWLRRRGLAEEMADAVEMLEMAVRDPQAARDSLGQDDELETPPFLAELSELVAEAGERPVHPYGVAVTDRGVVFEKPSAAVKKAESAWNKVWSWGKPSLVSLDAPLDPGVFEEAERWLAVLRRQPAAFDSPAVLDDLALLVSPLAEAPFPALAGALLEPLLARAMALVRASLAEHEDRRVEWGFLENRPVLRLLNQEALRLDRAGQAEGAAAVYAWMLRLNPDDNQGCREWLINHHLRAGANERALEIAGAYPDDFLGGTLFGRALARWRLGPRAEAEAALRAAAVDRPLVARALLAEKLPRPEIDTYGVAVGGEEEAWLYREDMLDVWRRAPEALEFLRSVPLPAARPRRRRRRSRGRREP